MKLSRLQRLPARVKRAARFEIHAHWRGQPVIPGTVLYESFSGNGMLCNPEAIFRALLDAPDFGHLRHIWVLSDLTLYADTIAEFAGRPDVTFVRYGSAAYLRALATSQYLVNNATFPADFSKRDGQVYLNTWHGTPLKKMGYDIPGGALATANIVRNFVATDFLLAANPFMADQMYETAYKLKNIYRGTIVDEGYPRIDRQFLGDSEREALRRRLGERGLALAGRKIVLYAPTWKGTSFAAPTDDIDTMLADVARIQAAVDSSRYLVLLKTHQIVHRLARTRPDLQRILVPNDLPTNAVLGVTDILVTDYSSIFFDFLVTGRPVVFYAPDLAGYAGTRGLYIDPADLPGPLCATTDEVGAELRAIAASGTDAVPPASAARYEAMKAEYCSRDDGHAAERVVDIVFRGRRDGYRLRTDHADGRPRILIYLGGMRPNGITTSALNLLNNVDHSRFDVSALFAQSTLPAVIKKHEAVPPGVRIFPRIGGMNGTKLLHLARRVEYRRGRIAAHSEDPMQNALWDDEWHRCFGDSQFDFVVDFSGYGPFWSALLLHSPDAVRSVWMHNDLASDAHREVHGRKRMLHSLTQLFSLYEQFDHLVSVSPTLAEINRRELASFAGPEKFTSAVNTVDATHILRNAARDLRTSARDRETGIAPSWVDDLLADDGITTFVTVGRLSPEKNQSRLIRAFARVHAERPETRLVIVGDGPLRDQLTGLIESLQLSHAVVLTGMQSNPHAIMAHADCFVLSSDYEGQPMVILEALVLGLPIVTVEFASAAHALPVGVGTVVPQTDAGVVAGMEAFLRGEVPTAVFDYEAYNHEAVEQFYRAIGAAPAEAHDPTLDPARD